MAALAGNARLMSESGSAPTVSVITPLYNSARHIAATLESLMAQTHGDWECVLVDDGSTDATHEAIAPFLADPRFSHIRQPNQGIAGARNTAIQAARGTWIALLDHDDRWLPTKLESQLGLARAAGSDLVATDATIVRGGERILYSECFPEHVRARLERLGDSDVDVLEFLLEANPLCASSVMLRRALFERHGLLDVAASSADDYDMWLRCARDARFDFVLEPLVEYFVHDANVSGDTAKLRRTIIYVLFKTLPRYEGDRARMRQFHAALAVHYAALFDELLRRGRYHAAVREGVSLLTRGRQGLAILARAAGLDRRVRSLAGRSLGRRGTPRPRSLFGR